MNHNTKLFVIITLVLIFIASVSDIIMTQSVLSITIAIISGLALIVAFNINEYE